MTNETQQAEPGFGRYRDSDTSHFADPRGFWEHTEEGWRWYNHLDDVSPGAWRDWEEVRIYGPFTPAFTEAAPAPEQLADFEVRRAALKMSVRAFSSKGYTPAQLIGMARLFEAYLKGGE